MSNPHDPFGFDAVDLEWLRAKPGQKWHKVSPLLAAWVADMDFAPAPVILDHLRSVIDSGDLGYPVRDEKRRMRSVGAFAAWMGARHGWTIDTDRVREWNDVVQAVQAVLHVATSPGDGVIVHTPAYPPFFEAIDQTACRLVPVPAHIDGDTVTFDIDDLERRLTTESARVLLLCNPQNPTGRVFTRDELIRLVDLAERHDLLIISDEIHADLVFDDHVHVPIAAHRHDHIGIEVVQPGRAQVCGVALRCRLGGRTTRGPPRSPLRRNEHHGGRGRMGRMDERCRMARCGTGASRKHA